MIDEHELFLESHNTLLMITKLYGQPSFFVERGSMDYEAIEHLWDKKSVILTHSNDGIRTIHNGLSEETMNKVIQTLCESHLRLK